MSIKFRGVPFLKVLIKLNLLNYSYVNLGASLFAKLTLRARDEEILAPFKVGNQVSSTSNQVEDMSYKDRN